MSQSVDIRSGTEFVQHVHREYGTCAVLELRVLISDVVGRRLYAGPPGDLSPVAVEAIIIDPGTYYIFTVSARYEEAGNDAVEPKMFGWITPPLSPRPVLVGSNAVKLRWEALKPYGEYNTDLFRDAEYILEGAQAIEYRPGVVSKFRTDLAGNDYKVVARGIGLTEALVTNLKTAYWYNWRLTIQFAGVRYTSGCRPVATTQGTAPPPAPPTMVVKINRTPGLFKHDNETTTLKFVWRDQPYVLPAVKKYQLQMEERCKAHMGNGGKPVGGNGSCACKPWRTVYSDVHRYFKSKPASFGPAEWRIRLRSWNACGWSQFSQPLIINCRTHTELFPAGFIQLKNNDQSLECSMNSKEEEAYYFDDEFEDMPIESVHRDGPTPESNPKRAVSAPRGVAMVQADENEIRSLAIEYHLNEAIARKELVEFLLLFPPASSLIEGETQLTDL